MRRPGTKKKVNTHTSTAASRYCVNLSNSTSYMSLCMYALLSCSGLPGHRTGGRIQYMVVRSYGVRCRSYLPLIYSKGRMLVLHAMRAGISAGGREGGSDAAHA